tara:strand:+ start:1343 stop:1564 length:222 start_codon:yes stop_codon:yes gene_type:complete
MRKELLLKKIVEDESFRDKYWSEFTIKKDVIDYKPIILKSKNKYLNAILEMIYSEEKTPTIKYKQIIRIFDLV